MTTHTTKILQRVAIASAVIIAAGLVLSQRAYSDKKHSKAKKMSGMRTISDAQLKKAIAGWPMGPRRAVKQLTKKYGNPNGMTPKMVIWHNNGNWKRTIVHRDPVEHDFPMRHKDYVEQTVSYRVPADKLGEIPRYDGSVVVNRTVGEISARCDKEPMNLLAINLANDVARGEKTVEEARMMYGTIVARVLKGGTAPAIEKLLFTPPKDAGYRDSPIMDRVKVTRKRAR